MRIHSQFENRTVSDHHGFSCSYALFPFPTGIAMILSMCSLSVSYLKIEL